MRQVVMIVSASRRTDIPAFFAEWFFNRISEGFVLVRNPMNNSHVRKVSLKADDVDCIVFWTKNPQAVIPRLDTLTQYHYYFQFTINPYGQDIEPGLPDKTEIMDTFKKLSEKLGAHRLIWRYDPILLNEQYTVSYHAEHFEKMAYTLKGYTEKVTISFIDFYSKIQQNMLNFKIGEIDTEVKHEIAKQFAAIAHENSLLIDTCAEEIDLSRYGITHAKCIDAALIERITGKTMIAKKDKSQRPECGCAVSVDIGAYNTCRHGCLYCYANYNQSVVLKNMEKHNKLSPLLIGE